MEKKKIDFEAVAEDAGKGVKNLFSKAKDSLVKAVDQNDDGTFDKDDVSVIAGVISESAKKTATFMIDAAEEKSKNLEKKLLQPVFPEDLLDTEFQFSKLIRVTTIDKKRAESEVCQGSIGFMSTQKDLKVLNVYRDKVNAFGITLYPDADSEVYYVDPSDRDRYIALEDYFNYLKVARINELQKIAQDLGAKHFKVTYKEQKSSFSSQKAKAGLKGKAKGDSVSMDAARALAETEVASVEVAAEMDCPGHEPFEPTLAYLRREPSIQSLINLRMDKASPISYQKYTLKLSNSSGIKENDAVKIDGALKSMKISGNTTIANEVQNESKRFFEYEVDF